jgi:alpha-tubulin suppressor-like RCC1 family protein
LERGKQFLDKIKKGQLGLGDLLDRNYPKIIPGLNNIIQVSAGYQHSLVLHNNGSVYSFGLNSVNNFSIK